MLPHLKSRPWENELDVLFIVFFSYNQTEINGNTRKSLILLPAAIFPVPEVGI